MRLPDWQSRLALFVEERRAVPFAWGSNDCAMFARDAVKAMTGRDPVGKSLLYSTAAGAASILKKKSFERRLTGMFGEPVPRKLAQRGDVVLAEVEGRVLLGICLSDCWAAPCETGLAMRPMSEVISAWRV